MITRRDLPLDFTPLQPPPTDGNFELNFGDEDDKKKILRLVSELVSELLKQRIDRDTLGKDFLDSIYRMEDDLEDYCDPFNDDFNREKEFLINFHKMILPDILDPDLCEVTTILESVATKLNKIFSLIEKIRGSHIGSDFAELAHRTETDSLDKKALRFIQSTDKGQKFLDLVQRLDKEFFQEGQELDLDSLRSILSQLDKVLYGFGEHSIQLKPSSADSIKTFFAVLTMDIHTSISSIIDIEDKGIDEYINRFNKSREEAIQYYEEEISDMQEYASQVDWGNIDYPLIQKAAIEFSYFWYKLALKRLKECD